VLWELEDQLGLPGRVVIEPSSTLPAIVLLLIAFASGLRASGRWQTALGYLNAVPFGTPDPVFGRDLAFFVFQLPFWRMVLGWGTTLVVATLVLTLAIYILQRSLVLTTRGPRLAAGARSHLLVLGALLLALTGVGFWLDRFELVYSPRGVVFGASYTHVHASLPVLGALAVLADAPWPAWELGAAACGWSRAAARARRRVGGRLGSTRRCSALQLTPNELAAERPSSTTSG
jgi:uncharacterized membrane protein (UPF0182 family)